MSLLLTLPTELLSEIAENLAEDEQLEARAALALKNRLLYSIANPLPYRNPFMTDLWQLGDWVSTIEGWRRPLGSGGKARELPVIKSLSFEGFVEALPACHVCDSSLHKTYHHLRTLNLLLPFINSSLFNHLRALSFVDGEAPAELLARLLGPLKPLPSTLEELTLVRTGNEHEETSRVLLQYLQYFPDIVVGLSDVWEARHRRPLEDL